MNDVKSFREMFADKVLSAPVSDDISASILARASSKLRKEPEFRLTHNHWMTYGTFDYFMRSSRFVRILHGRNPISANSGSYELAIYWRDGVIVLADIIDHRVSATMLYALFRPNNPYEQNGLSKLLPVNMAYYTPGGAPEERPCDLAYFIEQQVNENLFDLLMDLRQGGVFLKEWPAGAQLWKRMFLAGTCDLNVPTEDGKSFIRPDTEGLLNLSKVRLEAMPDLVKKSIGFKFQ